MPMFGLFNHALILIITVSHWNTVLISDSKIFDEHLHNLYIIHHETVTAKLCYKKQMVLNKTTTAKYEKSEIQDIVIE